LYAIDRMLWVWLYRLWPRCLEAMVLVKPATVVQWHRQGFRLYWRWRSRSGRRPIARETRKLIREMCLANQLWGAPRIHGELLKLGIEISQATVAKYMLRRPRYPSPTWRTFLRNHALGIAAIDMFIVPSATFLLLFVMLVLAHDRRKIVRFDVTRHPTAGWLSRQVTEAFPWDTAPRFLLRDRDASYGEPFSKRVAAMGITEVITADVHLGRILMSRESSGRSGANVLTTSSSLTSAICVASSHLTSTTTTERGPICP
jgi:putative transposase